MTICQIIIRLFCIPAKYKKSEGIDAYYSPFSVFDFYIEMLSEHGISNSKI